MWLLVQYFVAWERVRRHGRQSAHTVKSRSSSVKLLSSSKKSAFKSLSDMHCEAPKLMLLSNRVSNDLDKREADACNPRLSHLGLKDKNPLPSSSELVSEMSSCSKLPRTA